MKKSLIALAILGSFVGSAAAQSNVTIYGVIDASISRSDSDSTDALWALDSGSWSGSRIGFKGVEDLGGGLSASFQLENGFGVDNGALGQNNRLFGRQAWVGLESKGLGAVRFGRQYTPLHIAVDSVDPFETGTSANSENLLLGGSLIGVAAADIGDVRINNSVSYTTPNFAGLSAQVVYGFGEVAGSSSDNRQIGASTTYANGPVHAVFALQTAKDSTGGDQKTYFVGGTYNFGVVKLHAAYQDIKIEDVVVDEGRARGYLLGATAPVGNGTVKASWVRLDDKDSDAKVDQFGIGYSYSLSKRTALYTTYAYIKADDGADEEKANQVQVGVRHLF